MTVLVVMGVSGCGKSTVAELLAERLGWPFQEGDALHPEANVDKMSAGRPLTDEDRWPWLEQVADWVEDRVRAEEDGIITCSALKRSYRDAIRRGGDAVVLVHLVGDRRTLEARMRVRRGHFMPASMLDSQLATLEDPEPDEPSIRVSIGQPPDRIVDEVVTGLRLDR
jgi:carbohydrate kinase (thermoresistant glucokinase family)